MRSGYKPHKVDIDSHSVDVIINITLYSHERVL